MLTADPEELVNTLAVAKIPTPIEQDRIEVRILSLALTGFFVAHLVVAMMYIALVPAAPLHQVAALSRVPWLVLCLFGVAALATLPHLVSLAFMPRFLAHRTPRWLACRAAAATAVLWFYLSALARPLDDGPLVFIYVGSGLGALVIAALFGISLNSQQLRHLAEKLLS